MFLQWIAKCELVPLAPDTYVLKKFSEKCQRTLCSMVVGFLNTEGVDIGDILPSGHHIRWSMEIIGHSFALQMDDADVIAGAIRIYEKWLGVDANAKTKDCRPPCMAKVEQAFIQDVLGQMTLLFDERTTTDNALVTKQVQLCSRVLEIFEAVAKRRGAQLSPQTWDRMIRLLLGAADGILHGSRSVLGNQLCGALVRILFELYLRSLAVCGPRGELWNLLQKFYRRWIHRHVVIEQWNAVTLALTRSLMRHLQTLETTKDVDIVWAESRVQSRVDMDMSLVSYAWYRLVRVVGHPTGFNDPDVYLVALKGISRLADEFTKIEHIPVVQWDQVLGALNSTLGNRETVHLSMLDGGDSGKNGAMTSYRNTNGSSSAKRSRSPPDVNTILRLLGPWLFDACLSRTPRYAACRSEALRCLGKLVTGFSNGRAKRIHWSYAVRSLMSVQSALLEGDDRIVAAAVFNWSRIFSSYGNHTLRGSAVITGSFHRGIERILRAAERLGPEEQSIGGIPLVLLRRACVEACASLLTLHTHLPRALIKEAEREIVQSSMAGITGLYSTLPKYTSSQVVALLVNSIKNENDPTNQQMMLWQLTVAIQQEASFWSTGLVSSENSQVPVTMLLMCSIVSKAARYKAPVMFTAFECLRHLSLVCEELFQYATSSVVHLVNACCDFIIASKPVIRSNRAPFFLDELMGAAYRCITEWVAVTPLLLSKPGVVSRIISAVIDTSDRTGSIAGRVSIAPVREASQKLLNMLMKHHVAQLDVETGGLNEKAVLDELCELDPAGVQQHCRFFSINKNAVLSVIEKPATRTSPAPETVIIMRDSSGRYVWRTKPRVRDGPRHRSVEEYEEYVETSGSLTASDLSDEDAALFADGADTELDQLDVDKDPLLQALRATHQSSNLMSWHIHPPFGAINGSDANSTSRQVQVIPGEGNSGLSSISERKASAIGREARDLQESVFTELLAMQDRADRDATANLRLGFSKCTAPRPPAREEALASWEVSRRMMTELGFLSVRNWGTLFAMKSAGGELLNELEELDKIPTKETFEFGVAYATSQGSEGGFDNIHVVSSVDIEVGITTVSKDYERFVQGLGERMDLADNNVSYAATSSRFVGDAVCHSSYGGETCFYVSTYPVKYRQQGGGSGGFVEPAVLLERSNVLIVWNETQVNYRPGSVLWESTFKLPTPSSQVVIIIDPLGNDLFCVRIAHEGSPLFNLRDVITREDENYVDDGEVHCARVLGPLQDGMVINGTWLAPLVRQTAINATMIARAYHRYQHAIGTTTLPPPDGPDWARERMLTSIIGKHMRPQLPGEFYGGLFSDVAQYAAREDGFEDDDDYGDEDGRSSDYNLFAHE